MKCYNNYLYKIEFLTFVWFLVDINIIVLFKEAQNKTWDLKKKKKILVN